MSGAKQVMSSQLLGKANRFLVLQALVDHGPLSRAQLARDLGVPRASIGVITNSLIELGTLQEESAESSKPVRGKPPRPLWFAKTAGLTISVSISAGQILVGLVNARGDVLEKFRTAIDRDIPAKDLTDLVLQQLDAISTPFSELESGVALVVPAQCDSDNNIIELCTIIPSLTLSDLPQSIAQHTGLQVRLEQDVRALASGEKWFGSGRGEQDFAVLQVDAGVGVGMVMRGHIFPGPALSSPQVGHTCVDQRGLPCSCGSIGCWETIASLAWLQGEAHARQVRTTDTEVLQSLQKLANSGDERARILLGDFLLNLSLGLANLVQVMRFPLFILEGELSQLEDQFVEQLEANITERLTTPIPFKIIPTGLLVEPLLLGGCATALSRHLGVTL